MMTVVEHGEEKLSPGAAAVVIAALSLICWLAVAVVFVALVSFL